MAETLEIIIKAVDKASKELKGVGSSMGSLRDVAKSAGVAVGIFTTALSTASAIAIKTADSSSKYILEMADLAIKTGATADEMSRLVQMGDDVRVSQESLELAFRNMANKGIAPTLESLYTLSDQYLAIQDPVARAQFAMENFGARSGQEMQKLLDKGGSALEKMAQRVDEYGQAVSDADVRVSQAYFDMKDSFSDMAQGFEKETGTTIMPAMISLMGGTMAAKKAFDDWLAGEAYPPTLYRIATAIAAGGTEWRNAQAAIRGNVDEVGFLKAAIEGLTDKSITIRTYHEDIEGPGPGWTGDSHPSYVAGDFYWTWNGTTYVRGGRVSDTRPLGGGRARGGPLTGLNLVGEEGPELIVDGVVLPAPETRRLLSLGLKPTRRLREDPTGGPGVSMAPPMGWSTWAGLAVALGSGATGAGTPFYEGGGGGPSLGGGGGATVEAAVEAATAASAATVTPAVTASARASQDMAREARADRQTIIANGESLVREIRTLKQELARAVSSAVQKAIG